MAWELFGATLIGIFSFLPLYMAPSSVAEIVKPLFVVLAVSLMLSWVLSLTQVPLMGAGMLVPPRRRQGYDTPFFRSFDRHPAFCATLSACRFRGCLRVVGPLSVGYERYAAELFPQSGQTLFQSRLHASRRVQHRRHVLVRGAYGAVAHGAERGQDRLLDDGRITSALLFWPAVRAVRLRISPTCWWSFTTRSIPRRWSAVLTTTCAARFPTCGYPRRCSSSLPCRMPR